MLSTIINNEEQLKTLVAKAMNRDYVAIDTEFIWEKTYYPIPALIQIGLSQEECYLIDFLAINDLSILGKLLACPKTEKIFHDACQDLTILVRATGTYPRNIFDTQCAAGFVGKSSSLSLGNLLFSVLGIHLKKTETRTNWLKRPLSKRQLEYALNDVRYLPDLRNAIIERTRESKLDQWLYEELKKYDDDELYKEKEVSIRMQKMKGVSHLVAEELSIIYQLLEWRENEARNINCPREHILSDKTVVNIAKIKPQNREELMKIREFKKKQIKNYQEQIIVKVAKGLAVTNDEFLPRKNNHRFYDFNAINARIDLLMAFIKGKCIHEGIDPALVTSRSEINDFVKQYRGQRKNAHRIMKGWRKNFVGDDIHGILAGDYGLKLNPTTGLPQIKFFSSSE